ncbi:phytanoyl-CoA dioxygenase family protein [Verrucomicrobia bacterium]|nr:phytanoyl-CoA dioxygenase family protein [Verrucomicrobiota bacterium]
MESSFNQEGMMRIEGVFSKDLIQRLHNAYFDVYAVGDKGKAQSVRFDVGYGDRFLYPVVFRHPFDHPSLYDSSLLFPLLRRILGEQLIIQSFGIVSSMPGCLQQDIHQDHTDLFPGIPEFCRFLPSYAVTVLIPLIDLSEQTGSTAIWPKSHRDANVVPSVDDPESYKGAVIHYPQCGDCLLWDIRTWHSGMPNLGLVERPLLYLTVSRKWFQDYWSFRNWRERRPLTVSQTFLNGLDEKYLSLFPRAKIC